MRRRVQRWGNSLAVRIPADLAAACSIAEGSEVERSFWMSWLA